MVKKCIKKPFIVLVAVIICLTLAAVSLTRMGTDLLPEMDLPYMVVVTTYPGASPEKVESNVTKPLESALGTVSNVENVTSTSAENYAMVMLEFSDGTDMDSSMVKVRSAIDSISLPDECGTPNIMEISMDMMATQYVALSYDGKDIYELSDFIEETVTPYYERQEGVASVTTLGLVDEYVEVRLNQDKVDAINDKLLAKVNASLSDAKTEIDEAQAKLDEARSNMSSGTESLESQQSSTAGQLADATLGLNQALATQAAYEAQLSGQKANQSALEMEKKAYEDAGLSEKYAQLNALFASLQESSTGEEAYQSLYQSIYQTLLLQTVQNAADQAGLGTAVTTDNVEEILASLGEETAQTIRTSVQEAAETAAKAQLSSMSGQYPSSVEDAIANPDKLQAAVTLLEAQGQQEAASQLTLENLQQISQVVNTRIPQIETELANLQVEIAASQAVADKVNAAVSQAMASYTTVEASKILAAAGFGSASAQLASGQSAIENGQTQLDSALEAYENGRDQALKNANIDALLDLTTLSGIITAQNFTMPAGYVDDENDNQWMLKVGEAISSMDELENLLLTTIDGIGDICLKDVADITTLSNAGDSYTKVNGDNAVVLAIYKNSTASTSEVSKTCQNAAASLEKDYEGLHISPLMDQGDYISIFIKNILSSILIGAALAILVLAVFLKAVLPTLVVAFSIPFSVLVAILIMYFSGLTLNIMTLSGLALAIGMLVDNAIVVMENIFRLRNRGLKAPRAAYQGTRQMTGSIVASTLTTICVFLPMIFTTGLVRQLMLPFALTLTFALGASLLVALTVVPTLSSLLLKKTKPAKKGLFDKLLNGYERVLDFCLKRKAVPLLGSLLLLVFSVAAILKAGVVLIPDMASDSISVTVSCLDKDISKDEGYAIADQVMEAALDIDHLSIIGGMNNAQSLMSGISASDNTTYAFYLVPDDTVTKEKQIYRLVDEIKEKTAGIEGAEITVSASAMSSMSTMLGEGLSISVYGENLDDMKKVSEDFVGLVNEIDGFENASNGQEAADSTLHLLIDKTEAMRCGLTVAQIYQQLASDLTTEKSAVTLNMGDKDYEVVIVNDNKAPLKENILDEEFEVTTANAEGEQESKTYKLGDFASLQEEEGYETISRENNVRCMTVTADTADGYNTTLLTNTLKEKLNDYELPDGITYEFSGEYDNVISMVSQMLLMALLGLVFIYLVMVAQFQSLLSPFIILFTIPLAFTGGFLALLIAGEKLSMMSLMGFLILMGTVVNNGIVFVDYTNQLRLAGMGKRDALRAAGKTRMRPILMTALTTILSMATLIFDQSTSAGMSRGMALVVAGGLLYATIMTMLVVPVMYDIFYRRKPKVVEVGDDSMDDVPDDAAEFMAELAAGRKRDDKKKTAYPEDETGYEEADGSEESIKENSPEEGTEDLIDKGNKK